MATSNAVDRLVAEWRAFLHEHQINELVVGYSGGLDSHVLLHLLATYFSDCVIHAIYVDHQQSPHAKQWQAHTQAVCEGLGVSYQAVSIHHPPTSGESLEAFLRDQRYAIFKRHVNNCKTALMVAHHADDQAETVLLRLLRGAGAVGLSAMQASQPFADGWLLRPLLGLPKMELENYAHAQQLQWVEDDSNQNTAFDRNYLRQTVVPLLKERWPGMHKTLSRTALLCQETKQLVEEVAAADGVVADNPLHWQRLRSLSLTRQANAVRTWLLYLGVLSPTQLQLRELLHQLQTAADDKMPTLYLESGVIRYYRHHLYYCAQKTDAAFLPQKWDLGEDLKVGDGYLTVQRQLGAGLSEAKIEKPLRVAARSGGEKLKFGHSLCRQSLKNCWQQWGVPPWQRMHYPLLYQGDTLIAVPNWAVGHEWAAAADEVGLVVEWKTDRRES